jgi:hypothetical protein
MLESVEEGVRVIGRPPRPFLALPILCVAFPALRPLRTPNTEALIEQKERNRPLVADLAPLVAGGIDPRPQNVRDWLFKLDHQIKTEIVGGNANGPAKRTLNYFYHCVGKLATGLSLEPGPIDVTSKMIKVRTLGVDVPIELVSQGTASLLGWVGYLLSRLAELYPSLSDFSEAEAVVIIDELDAHMHPRWQLQVTESLTELFPRIQFICSSHSPLIVAGLRKENVQVLRRDSAGQVTVCSPPEDPKGLRADQILTSPAFDLESTQDPETQRMLETYSKLAPIDKAELGEHEKRQLHAALEYLDLHEPSSRQTAEARLAYELIHEAVRGKLALLKPEQRAKVEEEMRVQTLESVTGQYRPD